MHAIATLPDGVDDGAVSSRPHSGGRLYLSRILLPFEFQPLVDTFAGFRGLLTSANQARLSAARRDT